MFLILGSLLYSKAGKVKSLGFKRVHSSRVKLEKMAEPDVEGVGIRWLITKDDGAPHFAMRLFEIQPEGYSSLHAHQWEHEVYILEGDCKVVCEGQERKASAGYAVFIPPNATHQFTNIGKSMLKFLCLVPHHK